MAKLKRATGTLASYLFVIFMSLIVIAPILILVIASFKSQKEFIHTSVLTLPSSWSLSNYFSVADRANLVTALKNTVIITVSSVIINVILGSTFAYALGRFEFKGRKLIIAMVMGANIIPTVTTQVAIFTIIRSLGLFNKLSAAIVLYAGADVVQVLLYQQAIEAIPRSLDESVMIDGGSYLQIFLHIILPLLKPTTITVIILKIVAIYNDMYIPYLYMPSVKLQVVSTSLMTFCSSNYGSQVPMLSAAFILVMIPILLIYIFAQRLLFDGITSGAVKE